MFGSPSDEWSWDALSLIEILYITLDNSKQQWTDVFVQVTQICTSPTCYLVTHLFKIQILTSIRLEGDIEQT